VGGWMEVKVVLRIAYSNKKEAYKVKCKVLFFQKCQQLL
jgi:hypothetical protein